MTKKQLKQIAEMSEGVPMDLVKLIAENTEHVLGVPSYEIVYPFDSEPFIDLWNLYKEHRKLKGSKKAYTKIGEQAALKKLSRLSEGREEVAIEIIEQTLEENWIGLFKLKDNGTKEGTSDDYKRKVISDLFANE